jgi:hypothetical protein
MIHDGMEGLLFEPGDAQSCARALERAARMSGQERSAIGGRAAARIIELCGNSGVVPKRIAMFGEAIERHQRRLAQRRERRAFVVVGRGRAGNEQVRALKDAADASGAAFAHGWTRDSQGSIRAFASPRVRTLLGAEQAIGPLVVDERAWRSCEAAMASRRAGDNGDMTSASTWGTALALAGAGLEGIVVPDGVVDADDPMERGVVKRVAGLERAAAEGRIAAHELQQIRNSRGWRFVQRVYDVLHVVRGRGLKR